MLEITHQIGSLYSVCDIPYGSWFKDVSPDLDGEEDRPIYVKICKAKSGGRPVVLCQLLGSLKEPMQGDEILLNPYHTVEFAG